MSDMLKMVQTIKWTQLKTRRLSNDNFSFYIYHALPSREVGVQLCVSKKHMEEES